MRLIVLFALLFAAVLPARAAPLSPFQAGLLERLIYTETFDTATKQALGGVLSSRAEGPWMVSFEGGAARFVNDSDNSAVRYVSLDAMQFGGVRSQTDGAEEKTSVKIVDTQNGGAGIVMGYTGGGDYLIFALSSRDQYSILEKADGKMSRLTVGENAAIHAGQFNALSVSQNAGHFDFLVNGVKVFDIDRQKLAGAPIGIAVFGKGEYLFDRVDVVPPVSILDVLAKQAESCDFPVIDPGSAIMLAAVDRAGAVSSVSLLGQDAETGAVAVQVAEGTQPIQVIALQNSGAMVWQFSGATSRIAGILILTREHSTAAVAGIDGKLVRFTQMGNCLDQFPQPKMLPAFYVTAALALGRAPDGFAVGSDVGAISAPDGQMKTVRNGLETEGLPAHVNTALLKSVLDYSPGGVLTIDPAGVISNTPVEPYEVVPGQWGLVQLMAEGRLVDAGVDLKGNRLRFRITGPMRFPANLTGAQSVVFLLPDGVPRPAGNPGHSPVIPEHPPGPWVPWTDLGQ